MSLSSCASPFAELLEQLVERLASGALGQHRGPHPRLTPLGDLTSLAVVLHHQEVVAGAGDRRQTEHLDRCRRRSLGDGVALVVDHGAHTTVGGARHDRVAHVQRATVDEDGGHGATPPVEVSLDRHALCGHVRVGPEVEVGVGGEDDGLEELGQAGPRRRGDVDEHRVAAVLLGDEAELGELPTNLDGVGAFLVHLVDRDHDRHLSRPGVVQRLDRLGHHTVVSGHDEHRDVGRLRTTGTHGGERLVARGVDERHLALVAVDDGLDLVGTDGLRDAAGLPCHDVRLAQRVEQLRLAMVDVTHDGDDRRTCHEVVVAALVLAELDVEALEELAILVLGRDDLDVVVQLGADDLERVVGHGLRGGDHLTEVEQDLYERRRLDADLLGEVGQRGAASEADGGAVTLTDPDATDRRGLHLVELLTTLLLRLASTTTRSTGATERALRTGATTATTTTATTGGSATRSATRSATGTTRSTGADATTTTAGTARTTRAATGAPTGRGATELAGGLLRHHARVRTRHPTGTRPVEPPGRGIRESVPAPKPPGRAGAAPAASGRGAGRRTPMPCDEAYGLLPGRGVPGRRFAAPGAAGAVPGRGAGGRGAGAGAGRGPADGVDGRDASAAGRSVGAGAATGGAARARRRSSGRREPEQRASRQEQQASGRTSGSGCGCGRRGSSGAAAGAGRGVRAAGAGAGAADAGAEGAGRLRRQGRNPRRTSRGPCGRQASRGSTTRTGRIRPCPSGW